MKIVLVISILVVSQFVFGSKALEEKIENFIFTNQLDSARIFSEQLLKVDHSEYSKILAAISTERNLKNSQYLIFIRKTNSNTSIDNIHFTSFTDKIIKEPIDVDEIDYDYVLIQWVIISRIAEEGGFEEVLARSQDLEKYVIQFDATQRDVKRAKLLLNSFKLLSNLVASDAKSGVALINKDFKIANEVKDTNLIIMLHYYRSEFCVSEGDMEKFLYHTNTALDLDAQLHTRSPFYFSCIINLIDALTHLGGREEEVFQLLMELYNNESNKPLSYSYFANFVRKIDTNSVYVDSVFNLFEAENVHEFCDKLDRLGKDEVSPNEYRYIIQYCGYVLHKFGYSEEGIQLMERGIFHVSHIYTHELSGQIAAIEADKIRSAKEAEIQLEKSKTSRLYLITTLALIILVFTIRIVVWSRSKNKALAQKNKEIEEQKNKIEESDQEKTLLLKEIHHRVKNNFQIVSSLLELQTKGIEDEKAKDLAIEGQNRVKSMALIHQKLYQNDDLTVNFREYIESLVTTINATYSNTAINTELNLPEKFELDIDTAIPLGLIVNELITNSFKYVFSKTEHSKLKIDIEKSDDALCLKFNDFGTGLPEDIDINKTKSLGLRLVNRLSKQLHGRFVYKSEPTPIFEIHFKDSNLRALVQ